MKTFPMIVIEHVTPVQRAQFVNDWLAAGGDLNALAGARAPVF